MDTINLRAVLRKELSDEDRKFLKSKRWIKSVKYNDECTYTLGVSFPQFFDETNAYLITQQKEVRKVIAGLDCTMGEIGNNIKEATVLRIDYPFTYYMSEGLKFSDYKPVFEILGKASKMASVKSIEEVRKNEKETYTYADHTDLRRARNKVVIYDQSRKLQDRNIELYNKSKSKYLDLDKRIRVEVSLEAEDDWDRLNLKTVKDRSFKYLEENLLDEEVIGQFISSEGDKLAATLKKEQKERGRVKHKEVLHRERAISYDIIKDAADKHYKKARGREEFLKSARETAVEYLGDYVQVYMATKKEINKMKKALNREKMKPVK